MSPVRLCVENGSFFAGARTLSGFFFLGSRQRRRGSRVRLIIARAISDRAAVGNRRPRCPQRLRSASIARFSSEYCRCTSSSSSLSRFPQLICARMIFLPRALPAKNIGLPRNLTTHDNFIRLTKRRLPYVGPPKASIPLRKLRFTFAGHEIVLLH